MTEHPANRTLWKEPTVLRLLIVAVLAEIGYAVLNISTMPVYLRDDRKFGATAVALVLTGFLISEAVMKSPMGHFADRYGSRRLMLIAPLITIGTCVASLFLPRSEGAPIEILGFVLLRLLDGVGAAMIWPSAFAMMSNSVPDAKRQQGMSLLNMCYMVGIALALPIGGLVEDSTASLFKSSTGSNSGGIMLAALLFAGVFLTVHFFVKTDAKPTEDHDEAQGLKTLLSTFKQIPAYLILSLVTFIGLGFPMTIIKFFALDEFGLSATQFGAFVMPGAILMAVMSVPVSKFGEKLGKARAVHWGMALCGAGISLICLGAIFSAFRSPVVLGLAGVPVGLGFLMVVPAWMASVADLDPAKRAANIGAVMTAQGIGAVIGAPLGGMAYEKLVPVGQAVNIPHLGHYSPFIATAVCLWLAFLISLRILREP
ncbi:MAG: MFS transporter [Fimbriimonadaceae bacterium]